MRGTCCVNRVISHLSKFLFVHFFFSSTAQFIATRSSTYMCIGLVCQRVCMCCWFPAARSLSAAGQFQYQVQHKYVYLDNNQGLRKLAGELVRMRKTARCNMSLHLELLGAESLFGSFLHTFFFAVHRCWVSGWWRTRNNLVLIHHVSAGSFKAYGDVSLLR
jgi:hypothetical protein